MGHGRQVLAAVFVIGVAAGGLNGAGAANRQSAIRNPQPLERDYFVKPVGFNRVNVRDGFWSPRLQINRTVTIPYCFQRCEETGRIRNFEKAAGLREGKHEGIYFNDSDVYKVMEGAAYSLQVHPDTMMRLYLDKLIEIMAKAQWEDGYLYTFYSVPQRQPGKRWTNEKDMHEQYCMGHMLEGAVAHYQVTGDKAFLEIATKCADYICQVFGPGKRTDPPGHQEIEIGLCRLYRVTGDGKYLDMAQFLLDQRGRAGNRGPDGNSGLYGEYAQDHIPVVEQTEATGHSVRAAYMYTGMADVAALTGSMEYIKAIESIWHDVVGTKLYVTGGIGASGGNEGFSGKYELPNLTAYCETCASFANIFWNHRMFLMQGDAKYIDVLERTLYNAALSGIGMKGDRFFYPNRLESNGDERSPWFDCACCPSNVARFVPSVPGYAYACKDNEVYVNLFLSGDATIQTAGNRIKLIQQTEYPWKGDMTIMVEPEKSATFAVHVRIPGWARNEPVPSDLYKCTGTVSDEPVLKVNGERVTLSLEKGFARIERQWEQGDRIDLNLPLPVRRIVARPEVKADQGKVALQRGPLVFCLEGPDNDGKVLNMVIADDVKLASEHRGDLLNGVTVITGRARIAKRALDGTVAVAGTRDFTAIPYYAWAHRGRSEMTVWPARELLAARPDPADTLAYTGKTTASFVHASLAAIKDQVMPENSADSSAQQLDFWPHKGTTEWVQFEWEDKHDISSVKVYWFDDTGRGECHLPKSWQVLYRNADGAFKPVKNTSSHGVEKDAFNKVAFEPVKTDALKLEIALQKEWSTGIQEVVIE
ncbi:MAG: glycoside hydrolase family 127 protein [Sedimentisphaerales bacterium]|nr:glycoside hydrolase family 127 protein [Sedimentisphaerales bacterium]